MLRDIKQKSSGLGAKIIMGILIIAFGFWGVSGSLISSATDGAATVNGEKIATSDFNQANQAAKNRLTSQFGDNIGSEYFDTINFKRGVMNQLVDAELLRQEAEKFDYDVAPEVIREYIESSPGLQIEGKFSKEAYANYLAQVNKSADLLQRDIKEDIKSAALPKMISQTAFALNSEVENQYKLSKQIRSFNYIEFSSKDYADKVTVTEEEINNHYKEFGQDFMTTEEVSVNYIELSTADLLENAEVTDEELQTYYQVRKDTLMEGEKRKAQHILLPVAGNEDEVKIEMEKIAVRIKAGEDFAAVAKEVSQDPGSAKNGGDLGWVAKDDMVKEFEDKLFSMNVGKISEPVLSSFGYHIIKLTELKSPHVPALEDIKDTLMEELKHEKAEELFLNQADELFTIIIDSDNVLEIAADTSGLTIHTTELFSNGRGMGIAANQDFSTAAFSDRIKLDGEISEMINLGESHITYIQINEHKPPVIKPLADVTEAISIKLKSEKSLALVEQKVKELAEKINAGETTLAEVAAELATDVVEAVDVTRVGSKQPFNLVKNVFTLKFDAQNPKATYVESAANAFAIVELKSVVAADVSAISDSEKDNIASQIERTTANSELINVTADLRNNASIKINEKVFEDSNQ